jgi:hypothetical protein
MGHSRIARTACSQTHLRTYHPEQSLCVAKAPHLAASSPDVGSTLPKAILNPTHHKSEIAPRHHVSRTCHLAVCLCRRIHHSQRHQPGLFVQSDRYVHIRQPSYEVHSREKREKLCQALPNPSFPSNTNKTKPLSSKINPQKPPINYPISLNLNQSIKERPRSLSGAFPFTNQYFTKQSGIAPAKSRLYRQPKPQVQTYL